MSHRNRCDAWFHHPIYDSYWKHYHLMQAWFQRCKNYELVGRTRVQKETSQGKGYRRHRNTEQDVRRRESYDNKTARRPGNSVGRALSHSRNPDPEECAHDDSDEESSEVQFELVVTDDYVEFLKHSAEFRRKRDAAKKADENANVEYIDISAITVDGLPSHGCPNVAEKLAVKKQQKESWYGEHAATIMGMETAMRCSFSRDQIRHNPVLWPNVPLRFNF